MILLFSEIDEAMTLLVLDNFKYQTSSEAMRNGVAGPALNRKGSQDSLVRIKLMMTSRGLVMGVSVEP